MRPIHPVPLHSLPLSLTFITFCRKRKKKEKEEKPLFPKELWFSSPSLCIPLPPPFCDINCSHTPGGVFFSGIKMPSAPDSFGRVVARKRLGVCFFSPSHTKCRFTFFFFLSPHEMKEEIETKHFEHTRGSRDEPRCRATPHQTGRGVCVSPQILHNLYKIKCPGQTCVWTMSSGRRYVCAFHHNLSHGFYRVMSVKFLFPHIFVSPGFERTNKGPIFFFFLVHHTQGVRYRHRFFLIVAKCQKPRNFRFFTSA